MNEGSPGPRRIASLAWPVLVGQVAVIANGLMDTVMAGRTSAEDVAAVGLGASIYITVFVAFMGVILAMTPIVAQHFGAGRLREIGADFKQGLWLTLLLAVPGCLLLGWTDLWLGFAQPPAAVAERTGLYLGAVTAALPAALVFRLFQAMNNGLSRPRVAMLINLAGVALKLPLNALFIDGVSMADGTVIVPALGGPGCGVATAVVAWLQVGIAITWLVRDPWYRPFGLAGWAAPAARQIGELLRLGVPIAAGTLVEVSAFTFMALFVARFGATVAASHQIAANLTALCFMVALSIANATSVLAAQALGAEHPTQARRVIRIGFRMTLGATLAIAALLLAGRRLIASAYSDDPAVVAAAASLITLVAAFHVFDGLQCFYANVLRAYRIATLPMCVYVVAMWGIGLGGGWWLTFAAPAGTFLAALDGTRAGATGFWVAGIGSVLCATLGLAAILASRWRRDAIARSSR